jgi:lipopolysaccharide export system permease protein
MTGILDRYLLREWLKIFLLAGLGLPLVVILIELTENLDEYLLKDLTLGDIALGYFFSLPDRIFLILPAAVLFATVFSLGRMARHFELVASKASGRSIYRTIVPVLAAALLATGIGLGIGELAPPATRRQLELLGTLEQRAQNTRYNFVYRGERGWTYTIRELNVARHTMRDAVFEREGTGADYPTLAVQATTVRFDTTTTAWTLHRGYFRIIADAEIEQAFAFDSMQMRTLTESPADLLIEPKKPEEMRYAELDRYITALERSGGDGRLLRVHLALKLAVPFTCIVIAIFSAPFVVSGPRSGGAFGVALSLSTAVVFLVLQQLSRTFGSGGIMAPELAAWLPNIVFLSIGLWVMQKAPT